tara:strand:+ start:46969 stop:47760 length:792 start_codon:yes stop_codon:yes gene_type:complete
MKMINKTLASGVPCIIPITDSGIIYTIGMDQIYGCPELVFYGCYNDHDISCRTGLSIINAIITKIKEGVITPETFDLIEIPGASYRSLTNSFEFVDGFFGCCPIPSEILDFKFLVDYYKGRPFDARQIIVAGPDHLLPWHVEAIPCPERDDQKLFYLGTESGKTEHIKRFHTLCWLPGCNTKASSTCSTCNNARYCSRKCQQTDWRRHKLFCPQYQIKEAKKTAKFDKNSTIKKDMQNIQNELDQVIKNVKCISQHTSIYTMD